MKKFHVVTALLLLASVAGTPAIRADGDVAAPALPPGIKRVYVGVEMLPVDAPTRKLFKVPEHEGMLVIAVAPGSPADGALAQGDIILRAGDAPVGAKGDLRAFLTDRKPGDTATFFILRGGEPKTVAVKLAANPLLLAQTAHPTPDTQELMRRLLERTRRDAGAQSDFFSNAASDIVIVGGSGTGFHSLSGRKVVRPEGAVLITEADGKTLVTVTDASGKVLASGAPDDAFLKQLPDWARDIVNGTSAPAVVVPEKKAEAPGA